MKKHAKAPSAGSNSGRAASRGPRRQGALGALLFALVLAVVACLAPGSATAAETRLLESSFGPDGTSSSAFIFPGAIAVDQGSHDVYVGEYGAGTVMKFNENGAPTNFSALGSNEIEGFTFYAFEGLEQIAVNSSSHDFYVASYTNGGVIQAFHQDGEPAEFTAGPGTGTNELHDIREVCGVAVDSSGDIYMGDYGDGVHVFASDGEEITSFPAPQPCNLAVASDGTVYVNQYVGPVVRYTPSEFPVTAATNFGAGDVVDPQSTLTVSVDPATDDLYVDHGNHVSVYGNSGATSLYEFGTGLESSEGIAVDSTSGKAYATGGEIGESTVQVYGPPVPLPSVASEDADGVTTTTATLHGTVNPENLPVTDCHFELVPSAQFASDEYESVTPSEEYPCVPAAIPTDSSAHAVKAEVSGLTASTTYHFRLVAANSNGAAEGNDRVLTTVIGAPTVGSQSAEAIGTTDAILSAKVNPKGAKTTYHVEYGSSAAYGQRSPESSAIGFGGDDSAHAVSVHIAGLDPGVAYHFRFVAANVAGEAEGEDTTFATYPSTPGLGACPNEQFRTGFGGRLPDCRAYEQVTPVDKHGANIQGAADSDQASSSGDRTTFYLTSGLPTSGGTSLLSSYVASRGGGGWSSESLLPLLEPTRRAYIVGWSEDLSAALDEAQTGGRSRDLYLREADGAYRLVASDPGPEEAYAELGGFAADTSHLVFDARGPLLPDAVPHKRNLYELDHGALSLAGRIPVAPATSCDDEGGPACVFGPEGASTFSGESISRDGSKVFFLDQASEQLYVREDGARTVQLSASQKTNGAGPGGTDPLGPKQPKFMKSTRDGAHTFFTSSEELTNNATTGVGQAIGRANLDGTEADQGFVPLPASANGVAVDGSHLYWVDTEAGTIARSNLDGSGADESFIGGADKPQFVAVDGSHVYWTNAASGANGAGTIGRANLDGTGVEQSFISGASNPQGIAVDGSHLYWANAGTTAATRAIGRANLDGTSPEQSFVAVTGSIRPAGIAVSASYIYWIRSGAIGRANLDGTSPSQSFVSGGISSPRGLALDGSYLYWADNNVIDNFLGGTGPAIDRVKLDGSEKVRPLVPTAGDQGVAVDGSHLYWATGDGRDTGNDLYRYDSASGGLTDIGADPNPGDPRGANVRSFLGSSADGSYVYFIADGVLAPGASPGGEVEHPNGSHTNFSNLYVAHAGSFSFITQIRGTYNGRVWGSGHRVSDSGTLVFGRDVGSSSSCALCVQFYRYTPADKGLACITCTATHPSEPGSAEFSAREVGYFVGFGPRHRVAPRNLSADGRRFFFETNDALVPADTNGAGDVYEWEAKGSGSCESESQNGGCLYLISSGTSAEGAHFLDSSSNGDDAFFFTEQQLVPGDGDDLMDVYDASVGGGLAAQHQLTPPTCSSTACQANPAPPPEPGTASSAYEGAGNVHKAPSGRRCPKGKRKVTRRGKTRCVRRRRHKRRHHRHHRRHHRRHVQPKRHHYRGGSK